MTEKQELNHLAIKCLRVHSCEFISVRVFSPNIHDSSVELSTKAVTLTSSTVYSVMVVDEPDLTLNTHLILHPIT